MPLAFSAGREGASAAEASTLKKKKNSNESEQSRKEEVRGCEGGKQEREVRTRKEGSAEEMRAVEEEEEVIRPAGDNGGTGWEREIERERERWVKWTVLR